MKFRVIAGIVLLVILFGCYVVAKNMNTEETSAPAAEESSSGGYGGLGK